VSEEREQAKTGCGNERHPDGPWHPATPIPLMTRRWGRKNPAWRRYEANKERWGCGCDSWGVTKLHEAVRLLEEAFGPSGTWKAPSDWVRRKDAFLTRLHAKTTAPQ
jgi:hypothetical protein